MKFLRITFRTFGPFEEETLDFTGEAGLRVIFGPNEAGKSCALRGVDAFMFGFHGQSKDNFRFKHSQFRVHALLENARGDLLECIRRKGNKDTLRKSCDKVALPNRSLTDFIGGLDQAQFGQLFGLDAERLVEGGASIADGKGELGAALLSAGAGMKGLRALAQHLEERLQALYRPGGKNQRIAECLREHRELETQIKDLLLSPETFAASVQADETARARVAELLQERKTVRTQLALLNRYRAALPTIDLLKKAKGRLDLVADAPLLSGDFGAKLEDARKTETRTTTEIAVLESEKTRLAEALTLLAQPSGPILNEENEFGELRKLVGADVKSREEQTKAETFSRDERGKARDVFRDLTGTTDWDQMDSLKPRLDERDRINKLANERSATVEDVTRQEKAVADAGRSLARARSKREASPTASDPAPWQCAVDEVAAAGPLEEQLDALNRASQGEERRLADDFARLNPAPQGNWREAPAQPVPLAETVEAYRHEFESAQARLAQISAEKNEIQGAAAGIRSSLIEKVGSEPIPTIAELTAARQDRDGGLHHVRQRLDGRATQHPEEDFTSRHAPRRALIDAVESSVRDCDTLADRLRHEADRVAAYQSLQQQLASLQDRLGKLDEEMRAAEAVRAEVERHWQVAWQASGITPAAPKVMQTWLSNWTKLCERVSAWRNGVRQGEELGQRIIALRDRLAAACPAAQKAISLVEALKLAKQAIAHATATHSDSASLDVEIARLQIALETATEDLEKARIRRGEWERRWTEAVAILRLKESSPSLETARNYLDSIDDMQQHLREMRMKDARVREIHTERSRLIERINALRLRIDAAARPTTADSLDADFRLVEIALQEASSQRTRHQETAKQLAEVEKKLGAARGNLSEARATLEALATEAGVKPDELPAAAQRARERTEATAQARLYEEALAQNALGEPMDAFMADVLAQRHALESQIDEYTQKVDRLDEDVTTAEATAREAKKTLANYQQASDEAAAAQQKAALLAARLQDQVVEYAALHLARSALDQAKNSYRARHQDTLLGKAGDYFRKLTDSAFSGIEIDNDEGKDVLKAVRAANRPDARVPVEGLSDGTRDQLFLALRLAGIEQHLKDREPIPLIIDDVLINFDDARAKATLGCLAELARKTQVILFTHHRHLVELAHAVDASTVVHNLEPCR